MKLTLIIPCYNEEDTISDLYREVLDVLGERYDFEMLFVDDGSRDGTLSKIVKLSESDDRVKYLSFSRNFGKEAAMLAGMKFSTGDYVCIIDSDLQHPPSMIPEMVAALDEGYDVAASRRTNRKGEAMFVSFFSRCFYGIINKMADINIKEGAQDFRVMKRKVVEGIINMPEYYRFSKGIFSWVGFRTKWFEHENTSRVKGKSKWSPFKLFKYAIDGIVSFSVVPLRIALVIGVIVSLAGFVYFITVVYDAIKYGADSSGFTTIISLLMLIGGTILLCLGILGEYIARMYIEVKRRPAFLISETNITNNIK
ncbi:MAG: glycosyltransferase family 2 protein [Oscillospiraceae bacterium]|nr:glycosyltransferase family 2 protein [Oscillospiraceae bacterium]